eukprot:g47.t1
MQAIFGRGAGSATNIEFWNQPERTGWLMKQGEYIKTWRRRWFVLKEGHIFWFKYSVVTRESVPRGVIPLRSCQSIKGAEDTLNKPCSFEVTTTILDRMFFIADTDKEKEDWINAIGRAIVSSSQSILQNDHPDYTTKS